MAQADISWFDALPPGKITTPPPAPASNGTPAGPDIQTPTGVITTTKTGKTDTSWFEALPPGRQTAATSAPPAASPQQTTGGNPSAPYLDSPNETAAPPPPPPEPPATWGNITGAVPSGLYRGVADVANIPTALANIPLAVAQGAGIGNSFRFKPLFNPNPTGYAAHGGLARGVESGAAALSSTAALGAAGKLATPFLPEGSAPAIMTDAISKTPPTALVAATAGGAAEEPINANAPERYRPWLKLGANFSAGGLLTGAETAAKAAVGKGITPEAAQLAQIGRDEYGIPIRGGQISGNRVVRTADSVLQSVPGSGHGGLDEEMQGAFNRAVSRTFGENATKVTPEVLQNARARIGGVLEDVENRNAVNWDDTLQRDLASIESNARNGLTDQEYAVVKRQLDNVLGRFSDSGDLAGTTYGNLMHKGAPLDAAANSANPNIANAVGDIRNALRESLTRSLSGEDAAAYQGARTQWKNMMTIEPLTQRADIVGGASPATGDIIPAQLRGVVNRSYPNSARASMGEVPLNDLANIGQRFLKEQRTSQTPERNAIMKWLEHGGMAIGGGLIGGGAEHMAIPSAGVLGTLAGAAAGTAALARGAGSVLRSDWYANRLINKAMSQPEASGLGERMTDISVPLLTSSGVRQISPPSATPQPSINPLTGVQEFSLEANQGHDDLSPSGIAGKMASGDLTDHAATQQWVNTNKRELRQTYGGQGLQNIIATAALTRKPGTLFAALNAEDPPPKLLEAMSQSGVKVPTDLLAVAISSPELTKLLSTRVGGTKLTNAAQNRLVAAVRKASGARVDDATDYNGGAGVRGPSADGGRVRPVSQGDERALSDASAGNQSPVLPPPSQVAAPPQILQGLRS